MTSSIQLLNPGSFAADSTSGSKLPHVLFVVDGFPKALGGGERIALRLASLLPRYGFRASVLTFALHPESSFRPAEAPCPVYLLPLTKTYDLQALRGAFALRHFLHDQKIQVVQTFFESSDLWAGLITRLSSPAKLVWSRRDMGILRGSKHTQAYRALRRLPNAVFAVSERVAEHVITVDQVPASRVHVIHNGLDVDTTLPSFLPPDPDSPIITTIGNIRHVKGHDLLLDAALQVLPHFPTAVFSIAGEVLEPEFYNLLKTKVDTLGLSSSFRFLGKITDLRSHLSAASIFVLPSRSEGFSNALIEAMAAGLPCIATDVGGNAEAIHNGENGLIVSPHDPAALAAAILSLLRDRRRSREFGIAARSTVATEFTSEAMMAKVSRIYRVLLER